ncbi:MAG: hypothetical protein M5U22_21395 [Thermoleophilia bacterium]|nr:hypothetical protein [Thermoleophilia bacterium]
MEQVVALLRAEQPGAELRLELILERSEIEEFDRGSLEEALAAIRAGQDEQALDLILQARPTPPTTTSTITKTQATAPPAGATGGSEEPPTTTPTTEQTGESAGPDGTAAGPAEEAAVEGVQVERSPGVAETGGVILVAGLLLLGLFARQDRSATDAGTSTTSSR